MDAPASPLPVPDAEVFGNLRQASSVKGVPLSTLRAAKNLGCPGFQANGRITWTQALADWIAEHGPEIEGELNNDKEAFITRRIKAAAIHQEIKNEQLVKGLIPKQDVIQTLTAISSAALAVLRARLEKELPQKIAGADAATIKIEMEKVVDEVCQTIAGGVDTWK